MDRYLVSRPASGGAAPDHTAVECTAVECTAVDCTAGAAGGTAAAAAGVTAVGMACDFRPNITQAEARSMVRCATWLVGRASIALVLSAAVAWADARRQLSRKTGEKKKAERQTYVAVALTLSKGRECLSGILSPLRASSKNKGFEHFGT